MRVLNVSLHKDNFSHLPTYYDMTIMNLSNGTSVAKVREAVEKVLTQEFYKKRPIANL